MLSKRCHEAFSNLKNPVFMRVFSVFGIIPTRQTKTELNGFSLSSILLCGRIWCKFPAIHRLWELLQSKSNQSVSLRDMVWLLFSIILYILENTRVVYNLSKLSSVFGWRYAQLLLELPAEAGRNFVADHWRNSINGFICCFKQVFGTLEPKLPDIICQGGLHPLGEECTHVHGADAEMVSKEGQGEICKETMLLHKLGDLGKG